MDQLPEFTDYSMENRTYKYFTGDPLYPFGYGLSYTSFDVTNLEINESNNRAEEGIIGKVTVTNTGAVDGDEVVQVYIKALDASVPMPKLSLVSFSRISLKAGESKEYTFHITPRQLAYYDESKSDWVIENGRYELFCGNGQPGFEHRKDLVSPAVLKCIVEV
jgi:beta-glucosidase